MRALFSFLTVLFTLAFFVTGVVYLIARTFGQIAWNPDSKMFRRMLDNLRSRLHPVSAGLVSWDAEMLGLLSLNRVNEKKRGWFTPFSSGQITTIYQEPVVAYVTQEMGKMRVTLARTSGLEFIFRRKGKETEIWLNNQPFGIFADGALLAPGKGSRLLARLERKPGEPQFPLLLGNTAPVSLSNPERASSPNPRALTLLRELNAEEETVALALALEQITR
ncbi:MAG: hypothetical protein IPH12_13905 [Saprospirales bacterium]|nr:hypothetical protein [Saprospirales bacterium]MBK8922829.1 hypothetical protein [Saprospirales bacterium]